MLFFLNNIRRRNELTLLWLVLQHGSCSYCAQYHQAIEGGNWELDGVVLVEPYHTLEILMYGSIACHLSVTQALIEPFFCVLSSPWWFVHSVRRGRTHLPWSTFSIWLSAKMFIVSFWKGMSAEWKSYALYVSRLWKIK